jgi:protoporphyrin/coproporphyrin ferrochelatase
LESLHERGVRHPFVFAPGFTTDCLETLDELGNEGRKQFADGGGDPALYYVAPCLNANDDWLEVLAEMVQANALGWAQPEPTVLFGKP